MGGPFPLTFIQHSSNLHIHQLTIVVYITQIATSSWDKTVCLWSAKDGTPSHTLYGSLHQSWAATFSPDSTLVTAGSGTGIIWIWNVATGEVVHRFKNDHEFNWVRSLAFTSNGRAITVGSAGGTLRLLDLATGEVLQRWQVDTSANCRAGSFNEVSNV